MSSSKAKAKGISATSFFDLKADLSKKEAELAKAKAEGRNLAVVGGKQRPDKKPTVWARQNKGVNARANRDVELEAISQPTLDSARSVLERKAKIYEKLRRGKTGGLNDAQYDALLVDFDSNTSTSKYYEERSSDEDESITVPKPPSRDARLVIHDDPMVEYEDEFGRVRTARRSEVPRNLVLDQEDQVDEDEDITIRNPVNHFPTYQPTDERIAEVAKQYAEENNPLNLHYDASQEVRAKGAGFYQFSGDEETRRAQMEELKASREETAKTRQELGAEDIMPGQDEGMTADGTISKAMEKRKREVEERRQLLEAKRRKLKAVKSERSARETDTAELVEGLIDVPRLSSRPVEPQPTAACDPFAALEAHASSRNGRQGAPNSGLFVALPSVDYKNKQKGKAKALPVANEADMFLDQLENEFLGSRVKR